MTSPAGADDDVPAQVRAAVEEHWGLRARRWSRLRGGMSSATWGVELPSAPGRRSSRYVAEVVRPALREGFLLGLVAASTVDAAGTPAGRPLPTPSGRAHVDVADGALALLEHVDGEPLDGRDAADLALAGSTLARAHAALRRRGAAPPRAFPSWLDPTAPHLDVEPWVRPAVAGALEEGRAADLERLPWGLLHGDPAPEAFLVVRSPTPRCGLVDWSSAVHGPLLYDVASALLYVGGPTTGRPLLEAYAAATGTAADDLLPAVRALLVLRWAVQADYFARRVATGDLTGVDDESANRRGLADARAALDGDADR